MAGAALGAPQSHFPWQVAFGEFAERSAEVRRRLSTMGAGCSWRTSVSFCVAGAALGASPSTLHHQTQHHQVSLENLSFILRGRCSTRSISVSFSVAGAALGAPPEVCGRPATIEYYGRWLLLRGRFQHLEDLSLILRGRQHSEHLSVILRGRCSTRSTSKEAAEVLQGLSTMEAGCCCVASAACTWRTSVSFCDAGAVLGGPQSHLAWPVQQLWTPAAFAWQVAALGGIQSHFAWQVERLEHLSVILRGRCSPPENLAMVGYTMDAGCFCVACRCSSWRTSVSFCVAGAALGAPQSHFAWQEQQSDYLSLILRSRCSTWRILQRGPQKCEFYGCQLLLRGRCCTWRTSVFFCVAGAVPGASQCHFAWQVQYLEHCQTSAEVRR